MGSRQRLPRAPLTHWQMTAQRMAGALSLSWGWASPLGWWVSPLAQWLGIPPINAGDAGLDPQVQEDPLEEGNWQPIHSRILVWEIPRTGEPWQSGSMGSPKKSNRTG